MVVGLCGKYKLVNAMPNVSVEAQYATGMLCGLSKEPERR